MARLDVRTIKNLMEQGMGVTEIAKKYGVTRQAVYDRLKRAEAKKGKQAGGYIPSDLRPYNNIMVDPETGYAVTVSGENRKIVGRMGDEKVTAFVNYHMDMMQMRQGCDKRDVPDLYNRFYRYLTYCAEHGIVPNNMNAYFAIGIARQDISAWHNSVRGTPEHKEFADMLMQFFASVHEQGATDGVLNPISAMFWQKAHDGMIEASKVEVVQDNPLGDRKSAEELAKIYDNLPD